MFLFVRFYGSCFKECTRVYGRAYLNKGLIRSWNHQSRDSRALSANSMWRLEAMSVGSTPCCAGPLLRVWAHPLSLGLLEAGGAMSPQGSPESVQRGIEKESTNDPYRPAIRVAASSPDVVPNTMHPKIRYGYLPSQPRCTDARWSQTIHKIDGSQNRKGLEKTVSYILVLGVKPLLAPPQESPAFRRGV